MKNLWSKWSLGVIAVGSACLGFANPFSVSFGGTNKSLMQINCNVNGKVSQYGVIDLNSGYTRLVTGPTSGWASSVDVMPIFWHGGSLYQGYPVTETYAFSGNNLVVTLTGRQQGLTTVATLTYTPPGQ